jgi:hypothetical protein
MKLIARRRTRAAALAGALLVPLLGVSGTAPASAAGTDTLVFLKGNQVWVAHADGSDAHQFTSAANGWASPSMDDAGNVVVVGGKARINPDGTDSDGSSEIYRFAPNGQQLGSPIPTWGSYSSPACPTYGPTSARVSPDGTKVAYGIWECGSYSYTALWTPITSTGLSFPGQTLGQEDFYHPQWVDSSQFVVSHAGPPITDTQNRWFVHATSAGDEVGPGWYDPAVTGTGAQGLINRQGTLLLAFEDDAANWLDAKPRNLRLFVWSSPSLATAESGGWHLDCTVTLNAAATSTPFRLSPSFSSDGTTVYWGDDTGIEAASLADRSNGCANVHPTLVIPGGSQPYASPAPLPSPGPGPVVQQSPHAAFKASTSHAEVGHKVRFNGGASTVGSAPITKWTWRFGDGRTGTGKVVRHVFHKPGRYKVKLVVTDQNGHRSTVRHVVRVHR